MAKMSALTDAELAEIQARADAALKIYPDALCPQNVKSLLAEVRRLKERVGEIEGRLQFLAGGTEPKLGNTTTPKRLWGES